MKCLFEHLGSKVILKNDLLSFNHEKVLKIAGSIGTLEAIQSFDNEATVKIGKRNYKVSQCNLELAE